MITTVGISGTQHGCTPGQLVVLEHTLMNFMVQGAYKFHHGDCVGVDDQAHQIATRLGYWVGVHPPLDQRRACGHQGDYRWPPRPFLVRNGDIVDCSEHVIIVPAGFHEVLRSGTWATYRRAKLQHVPITVIWPDGTLSAVQPGGALTAVQ